MPQFIGVVFGALLYAVGCYLAFAYVVGPLWPLVALAAAAAGVLLVAGVLAGVLLGVGRFAPVVVTPLDAPARLPATGTNFARDTAWVNYLFAQSRTDLGTALERTVELVVRMWTAMGRGVRNQPMSLVLWPLLLLPLIGAVALTAAAAVGAVVFYGVIAVVLGIAWLGWLAVVGAVRGADAGVRRMRRAKATCHHSGCNYRSTLPAYRCSECGEVHHDIRAGRQGAFVRRCGCGQLLPTTVLQASAGLVAVCQDCGRDLRSGAAVLTDVVLPVFGPASAGKTRLVLAGMLALAQHLKAVGGSMGLVGPESLATYREAGAVVRSGDETTKTDARRSPPGTTVRLSVGRRRAQLHLFDAAGELFSSREQSRELRFLDDAQGLVFILDPFSVPAVADDLRGPLAPRLVAARPAEERPEDSYLITAQWLKDQRVELGRLPLAVAVVKADLLLGLPPAAGLAAGSGSADIERWLRDKGLDNMVDGAQRDFGEVRFHLVSSLRDGPAGPAGELSPARPLLWLLRRSGFAVPEPASSAS